MNKRNINIPFLLLCFYMYFPFAFKGIGIYQYLLIYGISYIGIIFNIRKLKKYITTEYIVWAFICYLIIFAGSIIIPLGYRTNDFSYTRRLISIINLSSKSLFLISIFIRIYKENAKLDLYIKYYVLSCSILVCTTIIFLMFPSLKTFWKNNIIYNGANEIELAELRNYVTRYSIIGFSGFRQTFMCAISYILSMYLILSKSNVMKNISKYIVLLLSLLGTFFYGRIGLLVILCITSLIIPVLLIKKPKILITLILSVLILIVVINYLKDSNEIIRTWYNWAFSVFINYIETGDLSTGSSETLFTRMYFKMDTDTFLIGDGLYTSSSGGYYMRTDAGIMRPILFYGIFLTLMGYMSCLFILYGMYKKFKINNDNWGKFICFIILITLVAFEIKGEIFYFLISLILPIYILLRYNNDLQIKGEKYE